MVNFVFGQRRGQMLAERCRRASRRPAAERGQHLLVVGAARLALVLALQDRDAFKEAIRRRAERDGRRWRLRGLRCGRLVAVDDGRPEVRRDRLRIV